MKLVSRVSLFFLAALAVVLAGYSLLIFGIARYYLYHRFDEQLHSAFNTLVAAVEVEPDDVKFEPTDHTIRLGVETDVEDIRWAIYDDAGLPIETSPNIGHSPADAVLLSYATTAHEDVDAPQLIGPWRVLQTHLAAKDPKPASERDPLERAALVVTVARSTVDLQNTLRSLALLVTTASVLVWLVAAVVGRAYCRRALEPVRAMATEARRMQVAGTPLRLPVSPAADELADLGQAFNQLLDRSQQAWERQRRFTGDAAHQLRTPLTILQGQLDVALRRPRTTEEYTQTLSGLRSETAALSQMVESLLFLARSTDDDVVFDRQLLALEEWLPAHIKHWQPMARAADLELRILAAATIPTSPILLGQLLDNLWSNACKYSAAGTSITISLDRSDTQASLSVSDRGPGISPHEIPSIFDPFFRSAAARQSGVQGTGLGLAICRQIAQALGGELTCVSRPGEGSTFTLLLPLAE